MKSLGKRQHGLIHYYIIRRTIENGTRKKVSFVMEAALAPGVRLVPEALAGPGSVTVFVSRRGLGDGPAARVRGRRTRPGSVGDPAPVADSVAAAALALALGGWWGTRPTETGSRKRQRFVIDSI